MSNFTFAYALVGETSSAVGAMFRHIKVQVKCVGMVTEGGMFELDAGELGSADYVDYVDDGFIPSSFDSRGWCLDDVRGGSLPLALV